MVSYHTLDDSIEYYQALDDSVEYHREKRQALVNQVIHDVRLLVEKKRKEREEEVNIVYKLNTTKTENGVTILQSGQLLTHHKGDECTPPCALHSPIDGPWSEWPLMYNELDNGLYRVCPHNIAHPAVEQALYWIRVGSPGNITHGCCEECLCLPKQTLPPELFVGNRITVPASLMNWAQQEEKVESNIERDPNKWAADYLDRHLRYSGVPTDFYVVLRHGIVEGHTIENVDRTNDSLYYVGCTDNCHIRVCRANSSTPWEDRGESWCPTIRIALLAGWVPVEWDRDEEEEDEDDEDDERAD